MGLGTDLASILEGFKAGDANLLKALKAQKNQKDPQQTKEGISKLSQESHKNLFEKIKDSGVEWLGDKGLQIGNYSDLVENNMVIDQLVEDYLKKHHLPKNEKSRKRARNYLKNLASEELAQEFNLLPQDVKEAQKSTAPKENFEDEHPVLSSFKELLTRDPLSLQTYKDTAGVALKTPGRIGKYLMEALGGFDKMRLESLEKQGMVKEGPTLAEDFAPAVEGVTKFNKGIDNFIGSDPNAKHTLASEMLVDTALPGGPMARGGKFLPRLLKNTAIGAGIGGGYGALYSGGDPTAMKQGAAIGAVLHGGLGAKKTKNKKADLYHKIAEDMDDITIDQAQARAKLLGKDALLPEVVGSEDYINLLKQDSSKANKSRMKNMQKSLKQTGQDLQQELIRGEKGHLFENLNELDKSVKSQKNQLYDLAKGEGYLTSREVREFYKAIRSADPYTKGLPQFKPRKGNVSEKYLSEMQKLLSETPSSGYKEWFSKHENVLPTADDFIEYKSRIRKKLEADPGNNALINMQEALEKIVEKADKGSYLKQANKYYATHAAPFTKPHIEKAVNSSRYKSPQEAPSVLETFGKHSVENSKVFNQLPPDDKRRAIGSMLDEIIGDKGMRPDKAIMKLWEKLPDYIKLTNDTGLQKIFKEMRTLASMDKTLSSLQQSTTESMASRQAVEKASSIFRRLGYAGSLAGGIKSAAKFAGIDALIHLGKKVKNSRFKKPLNQKHLKEFFNRDLLQEMENKKRLSLQAPINKTLNAQEEL